MSPEEEFRFLILGLQRDGNRALAAMLAPLGVTPSQAEAIRCLADAGPISLRGLGGLLICEAGSPSRLVNALVERGLVERREDLEDRRHVVLALTDAGRSLETKILTVEMKLHAWISHKAGPANIPDMIGLLRPFLEDTASGEAIVRRKKLGPNGVRGQN